LRLLLGTKMERSERSESKRKWDRENIFRSMRAAGWAGKVSDIEKARIREMRAGGMKVKDIADQTGIGYGTVSQYTKDVAVKGKESEKRGKRGG